MSPVALIFDVQRFSIHDGPGVRTTVFFKGCPLRCRWCHNPESLRPRPELAFYGDRCRGSGGCVAACGQGAIAAPGAAGERVDRARCGPCDRCERACPYGAFRVVGREVPVDRLVEEVGRDRPFYESSGGGVTLSGGEPTAQMEAMGALARGCREAGIGVGLQTAGAFRWESFAPHLPLFDFIHYDIKLVDPDEHRRLTGADNRAIADNARRLVGAGAPVKFRTPVVPGLTDTDENLDAIAGFLHELGVGEVHLLCYHRTGESKLRALGFPLSPLDAGGPAQAAESAARASERLRRHGLEVLA